MIFIEIGEDSFLDFWPCLHITNCCLYHNNDRHQDLVAKFLAEVLSWDSQSKINKSL